VKKRERSSIARSRLEKFHLSLLRRINEMRRDSLQELKSTEPTSVKPKRQFDTASQYYRHFQELVMEEAAYVGYSAFRAVGNRISSRNRRANSRLLGTRNADFFSFELAIDTKLSLAALSRANVNHNPVLALRFLTSGEEMNVRGSLVVSLRSDCCGTARTRIGVLCNENGRLPASGKGAAVLIKIWASNESDDWTSIEEEIKAGETWEVTQLSSMLSFQRMHHVTEWRPTPVFMMELIGLPLSTHIRFDDEDDEDRDGGVDNVIPMKKDGKGGGDGRRDEGECEVGEKTAQRARSLKFSYGNEEKDDHLSDTFKMLNPSQKAAITGFLQPHAQSKMTLVQGPPGTGKTRTITELLKILIRKKMRVMVTAPSNKAVQVILSGLKSRLGESNLAAHLVLIGVQEEVSPLHMDVFLHAIPSIFKKRYQATERDVKRALAGFSAQFCTQRDVDTIVRRNHTTECRECSSNLVSVVVRELQEFIKAANRVQSYAPSFYRNRLQNETQRIKSSIRKFDHLLRPLNQDHNVNNSKESKKDEMEGSDAAFDNDDVDVGGWPCKRRELFESVKTNLLGALDAMSDSVSKVDDEAGWGEFERECLNEADVIFATLATAGRSVIRTVKPVEVVVVDEASAAIEPEFLLCLNPRPSRMFIVGDPKQLCAMVSSPNAKRNYLDVPLITRLIEWCGHPFSLLDTQYRMHPQISMFPCRWFYKGLLKDGDNTQNSGRYTVLSQTQIKPFSLVDVKHSRETRTWGGSYHNKDEAKICVRIVRDLVLLLKPNKRSQQAHISIVMIAMYSGQVGLLSQLCRQDMTLANHIVHHHHHHRCPYLRRHRHVSIVVSSVDSFQGSEADVVVLSTVRSNPKNSVGFVSDGRRLNVAITRAKQALVVCAHKDTLLRSRRPHLMELVNEADKRSVIISSDALAL